ncbi:hypothetical protein LTR72_007160 [Exophiala xenobiotica]|nr:hypothetical protein LTR41_008789 [Exophiala xenobiotica]KAK5220538.1 hypothetical protein LTR72_007160 [Exophiala xenobiotica]KAK5290811.1 hypothetical protein LTR14_006318 [Exophiala xenobiotica]KAK5497441.1 hypothetical protein LTR55_001933 [Exophiala xenobiotica]
MAAEVSSTMAPPTDLARNPPPPDSTIHQPPTFLTLPAEIRLRIYSLLFDEIWIYGRYKDQDCCWGYVCDNCRFGDDYVPAESDCQCRELRCVHRLCHCCTPLSFGLLRVCKIIHNEAVAVFDNAPLVVQTFEMYDPIHLCRTKYALRLPTHLHSRVEKLVVDAPQLHYGLFVALKDFKNLRSIWLKPRNLQWIKSDPRFAEALLAYTYDFYRFRLLPGQLIVPIVTYPKRFAGFSDLIGGLISTRSVTIKIDFWCSIEVIERVLSPNGKKKETSVLICGSTGFRLDKLPDLAKESWFNEWSQYARLGSATGYKEPSWDEEERYKVQLEFFDHS